MPVPTTNAEDALAQLNEVVGAECNPGDSLRTAMARVLDTSKWRADYSLMILDRAKPNLNTKNDSTLQWQVSHFR
jgi:hypothetical protein